MITDYNALQNEHRFDHGRQRAPVATGLGAERR